MASKRKTNSKIPKSVSKAAAGQVETFATVARQKPAKRVTGRSAEAAPAVKYELTAKDKEAIATYEARERSRSELPTMTIEFKKDGKTNVTVAPMAGGFENDYVASRVAMARFTEVLGGASLASATQMLAQIMSSITKKDSNKAEATNAAIAMIAGIKPRDELEALLAVQMVATHNLICEFQRRLMNSVETIPQQDSNGNLLVKLQRTFTTQMETLKRYRTGGEQRVSVLHQHVNVTADNAAVAINAPNGPAGGPGVEEKSEEQPHEPRQQQLTYVPGTPLPSAFQEDRKAVPESSR